MRFIKNHKLLLALLIASTVILSSFAATSAWAADKLKVDPTHRDVPYRILCISSYNYSFAIVPQQLDGLKDGLKAVPVDIDYEFMDTKNYYKSKDIDRFYSYLKYKLDRSSAFDLVVLCDDSALHFGINNRDELFPDTPIVFMGINNVTDAETASALNNVTGVAEILDFKANYRLMQDLFPDRKKIVIVVDNSNSAQGEFVEFEKFADETPDLEYSVINTSYYSKKGLERAFSEIDEKSQILYLDFLEDGDGNVYTIETGTKLLHKNAPDVPIFRASIADLEHGVLGGVSYSYYDAGKLAGLTTARILKGTDINRIRMNGDSVSQVYFEQYAMDHFDISVNDVPEEAIILNQHQTPLLFYKQHTLMMNLIFLIIFLMIVIIAILMYSNRRRQRLINQDFLTQMPNRTYITAKLAALDDSKTPFGLIMMDVDHFKTINDTLGHLIGDELLVEVAKRLKSFSPKDVIFARIGGDEFMGLIPSDSKEKAHQLCRELISKMKNDFNLSSGTINITVSVGAAMYPADTDHPSLVQGCADSALYDIKEAGRDGYKIYDRSEAEKETSSHPAESTEADD